MEAGVDAQVECARDALSGLIAQHPETAARAVDRLNHDLRLPTAAARLVSNRRERQLAASLRAERAVAELENALVDLEAAYLSADVHRDRLDALRAVLVDARGGGGPAAIYETVVVEDERELKMILVEHVQRVLGCSNRAASEAVFGNATAYTATRNALKKKRGAG